MQSFFNQNLFPIVQNTINGFRNKGQKEFLTKDAIEDQLGRYVVDNCDPNVSFNANYGKFLKENESVLRIKEIQKNVSITDQYQHNSTCSKWEILQ